MADPSIDQMEAVIKVIQQSMAEARADGNRFAVKTQFEGEAGEKLFRQQMRFKGDKRFARTSAVREVATGAAECGRCRR